MFAFIWSIDILDLLPTYYVCTYIIALGCETNCIFTVAQKVWRGQYGKLSFL